VSRETKDWYAVACLHGADTRRHPLIALIVRARSYFRCKPRGGSRCSRVIQEEGSRKRFGHPSPPSFICYHELIGRGSCSCRALQGSWKRADHEAELFQSDSFESLPGCDSVFTQGARVESRRAIGEHMGPVYVTYFLYTSDFFTQFTYINLAFSPAPDDTIANLYRVSPSPTCHSMQRLINRNIKSFATDGHLIVNYR
jgi:hypothetical protein